MCENSRFDRESAFDEVKGRSVVDPSIGYKIIEKDFLGEIDEGPEYMCDICICWNFTVKVNFRIEETNIFMLQFILLMLHRLILMRMKK